MHQSGTKRQVDEANEVCQQRASCYSGHGNQTASDTPPAKPSIIVTVSRSFSASLRRSDLLTLLPTIVVWAPVRSQHVTTNGRLFMIYPHIPFTCRTAPGSKRIQVLAVGWIIRTMPMKKCAVLLRRISTILN